MSKKRDHIIRLIMLASSFILLLTVVIPHHHHEDGLLCVNIHDQHHHEDGDSHQHGCDCTGHDLVFTSNILQDSSKDDVSLLLIPLLHIFDYANPPDIILFSAAFPYEEPVCIESLHSKWTPVATGLRAPPFVIS